MLGCGVCRGGATHGSWGGGSNICVCLSLLVFIFFFFLIKSLKKLCLLNKRGMLSLVGSFFSSPDAARKQRSFVIVDRTRTSLSLFSIPF